MFKRFINMKFVEEVAVSSVRMAVASEVAKGLQKLGRTVVVKAAGLAGFDTKQEDSDTTYFDDPKFDK